MIGHHNKESEHQLQLYKTIKVQVQSEPRCYTDQGYESVCEKKSEIIWNAWKDVLFNAFKVGKKKGFCEEQKVWN